MYICCGSDFVSIGEHIQKARKKAGLSQSRLAIIIGVDNNTISRWERDLFRVTGEYVPKIAAALNTSVAYLLGETDDPGQPAISNKEVESNIITPHPVNMIQLRVISKEYHVCCGSGIDWGSEAIEFESSILIDAPDLARRYSDGDLIGVRADGDSMEPHVFDSDLVIFAWREKIIPYAGAPMVVSYNNKMLVRGLVENNRKMITMKAHNKDYDDIIVTPDDDFSVCGRVVKVFSSREPRSVL
jgi:transcriptional regulator with XRE-family HTH domain